MEWPFNLTRDRGMKIIIDLGRVPDDSGRRMDVDYALRTLASNGMIEWLEWDRQFPTRPDSEDGDGR